MSKRVIRDIAERRRLPDFKGQKRTVKPIGLDRHNLTLSGRLDLFKPRSASKTKNLIRFLLGHGERAQRATLPKKYTKLCVYNSNGLPSVRLRFE